MRKIRGREISMIFQEPMSSLNPSMTCGDQVVEILLNHKYVNQKLPIKRLFHYLKKLNYLSLKQLL